jgi:peptidoglycan/xylan/chitin deacetylase (PgdA/CDA1 family)
MIFVSSWDDGHPLDERVAELLGKHGLKGTFFLPMRNREGLPVMDPAAARRLNERYEVGSHTLDHAYLWNLDEQEVVNQVKGGKAALEDVLGSRVNAFCYPGGQLNSSIRGVVKGAGFRSARTIENFRLEAGSDPYMIPTTLQFYPHRRTVLLRNFVKRGHYMLRAPALIELCSTRDWFAAILGLLRKSASSDDVFHLWGHSWELEKCDLWRPFEDFLMAVAACGPRTCTVSELVEAGNFAPTGANAQ